MDIANEKIDYEINGISFSSILKYCQITDFKTMVAIIERYFVYIFESDDTLNLNLAKKHMYQIFKDKTDDQKHGMVAEFFGHLIVNHFSFQRASCMCNLEDGSMKKGFDGLYTKDNEYFLFESKSGYTYSATHKDKLSEALSQIKECIAGDSDANVNPWTNAYNHFIISRNENCGVKEALSKLSKEYIEGIYHDLSEFNVIPCVTLFNLVDFQSSENLKTQFSKVLAKFPFKCIFVISIDNTVYDDFVKYIKNE